jgi:two-component system response regulator AlgR
MQVLIVEDEELARVRLKMLLGQCTDPPVEVAAEAGSAAQALRWLSDHRADVALLDIQMPGMSGIQLAEAMRGVAPDTLIIFLTAHADFAVDAFGLEAVDYLTKPIRLERLSEALARAHKRRAERPATPEALDHTNSLWVSDRGRMLRIALADILYLRAELKYVTLRTAQRSYVLDQSLAELEQRLGPRFVRVHRNALVARHAMRELQRRHDEEEGVEGWAVRVAPTDEWLAVSRRQAPVVKEAIAEG